MNIGFTLFTRAEMLLKRILNKEINTQQNMVSPTRELILYVLQNNQCMLRNLQILEKL